MSEEIVEVTDAREFPWDGSADVETPTAWFDNQQMFSRVRGALSAGTEGNSRGIAWGDYNNDAYPDLLITNLDTQNQLFKNNQDGSFSIADAPPVSTDLRESVSPAWGDYDNDGDIDLFIANKGQSSGQNNILYRNDGAGSFTKILSQSIVTDSEFSSGSSPGLIMIATVFLISWFPTLGN